MSTWANTSKNTATMANMSKSNSEVIYLVSESLDYYLVGASEDETLVTQDLMSWSNLTKN